MDGKQHMSCGATGPESAGPRRASEEIYRQIRDKMLAGALKPGDRLPSERGMIAEFGRSRPTIREALRMLERDGLVSVPPGRSGAVVRACGTEQAEQALAVLFEMDRISRKEAAQYYGDTAEAMAGRAAERRTQEDLDGMADLLYRSKSAVADYGAFLELDAAFHQLIAEASKNGVAHIMEKLLGGVVTGALLGHMRAMTEKDRAWMCSKMLTAHQRVYSAVQTGNAQEAKNAMALHMQTILQGLSTSVGGW